MKKNYNIDSIIKNREDDFDHLLFWMRTYAKSTKRKI
jgi:hypothetical protein